LEQEELHQQEDLDPKELHQQELNQKLIYLEEVMQIKLQIQRVALLLVAKFNKKNSQAPQNL
jgi:hypothetical protein